MAVSEVADFWQEACSELKQRGARLLRSGLWADCAFLVGTAQQRVRAHQLILGMASPVFERMFYGALPPDGEPVPLPDVEPDAFTALLEYIYTDDPKINSFCHAFELYRTAHMYMLPHLVQLCSTYLSSFLVPEDACRCYELALFYKDETLLDKALEVIITKTKNVLEADSFLEAELNTVVTVLKQEALNIESELDLFTAVERYARSLDSKSVESLDNLKSLKVKPETSRTHKQEEHTETQAGINSEIINPGCNNDNNNLTIPDSEHGCSKISQTGTSTIHDAVQQIRFLTLTAQQFAKGPARSTLLAQDESFAILMNILSKSTETAMPSGLSTSRKSRDQTNEYGIKETTIRLVVNNFNDLNEAVWSDTVIVQSLPWRIEMVPGIKSDLNRQVSVYLTCDGVKGSKYWSCVVELEFRLLSSQPYIKPSRAEDLIFSSGSSSMGYPRFIRWAAVVDPANGYIRNGTVTFEVHFIVKKVQTY